MSKSPVMRALSMLLSICMVFGMVYLPANASTYDVANMTNAEVLNLCIELSSKGDEEALAAIEADLGAIRAAEVEALYAALNADEPATVADSTAKVTAYKQVSYATAKVVDAKYFEEIGTAADLEGAVTLIKATGANGGLIEISAGTLYVTDRQDITMANLIIKGAGKTATTIAGDTAKFNNTTNGLANKNGLSSEYKTLLGLPAENLKVMDLTIDGTGCGHDFGLFSGGRADFKTVRINSGVSYLENVAIKGNKGRSNLMIGTSSTKSTVYATNISVAKAYTVYGDTEIASGSKLTAVNSVLGGTVVGSTENLGAGYYKLSYNGLVAYTTIPYAIECYKAGTFADMLASVCTNEGIAAGTSVAAAMTADLTTVLTGKTTLLYGYDCAEMKALAAEFKTALAGLSADTKVDVSACLEKLTEALAIANWHTADFAGTCTNCGAEGLKAPTVQVPAVDELVSDSHTEAEKEVIENVATEIKQNTALDEFIPTNLPENTTLSVQLTSMGVENGTAYKLTFEVAPKDFMGTTIQPNGMVTFRLPIPASVIKTHANVYHNGDLMGTYEIEGDGNGKYVEVETASFSEFTVETVDAPVTSVEVDTLEELQSALAADNDLTIVITSTIVIPEGQTVTIDLNGKTVTVPEATKHIYALNNKGILTLKDSKGTGSISARGIYNGYDGVSTDTTVAGAKMIVESGKYIALDSNGGAAIFNCAELIVNGGTFEGYVTLNNRLRGVMTINNATVNGAGHYAVQNNGGKLTINNATVNGKFGCVGQWEPTAETVINGGYFAFTGIEGNTSSCYFVGAGQAQINDGTFKKIGDVDLTNEGAYTLSCQTDATVEINGGTFTSVYKTATGMFSGKGALSVKGGTYYNIDGTVCNISDKVAEGFELGEDGKVTASVVLPDYVVLPEGMDASNYETLFGEYTVTDGNTYWKTLQAALKAIYGTEGAVLYCKPGADVGGMTHGAVMASLTVYGNDAFTSGNGDFDIGNVNKGYKDIIADMTLTVKYLHGSGAWGAKATEHTVNLVFENCKDMSEIYLSQTTGVLNITLTDCEFTDNVDGGNCKVYSNANGKVTLTRVLFQGVDKAVNLNHKVAGLQEIVITDCTFIDCGDDVASDEIPVRVLSSVEGGESKLTLSGCTFTGTVEGGADILLDYGVGTTNAAISGTAADVVLELEKNVGTTTTLTGTETMDFTNVVPTYVAQIGEQKFETLEEALEAANGGEVEILCDITEELGSFTNVTLTTKVAGGVTITDTFDGWVGFDNVKLGAGVTLNAGNVFLSQGENVIEGTMVVNATFYHGYGAKTTVQNGGQIKIKGNTILRYNGSANAGIFVYGDNDASTVEYDCDGYIGAYSGTFYAKDANVEAGYILLTNTTDGSKYAAATMELDNTVVNVVGASNTSDRINMSGKVNLTLKNNAKIEDVRDMDISAGTELTLSVEEDCSISVKYPNIAADVPFVKVDNGDGTFGLAAAKTYVAQIGEQKFESLTEALKAAQAGETIVLLADISLTEVLTIAADKNIVLDLAGFAITRTVSQTVSENTYLLINDGILTITDSVGEGLIELTYTGEKVARSISTICNRGTLNIQGGTINNNPGANSISYAIDNNSTISNAVINITGGSVTGGAQAYCIRLYLNSTVYANELNMTGGSVQYVWAQNPNTYANKGSISMTGDAEAWYVYVSAVAGECNAQNIALNVEEGTCYYAPACGTLAEGYALKLVDGVYKIVPVAYVAQIGEQKFETLAEALKAAQAGETIVLLADISLTEALTIAADKDVVLDLAGKILSYASAEAKASAVITNKGKLTVKDSVGGGKITTSALNPDQSTVMPHYANNTISNLGQLIIDSGKIENTTNGVACYAIDNYSGATLTVNDGEIVSVYSDAIRLFATDAAAATVIINGGTVGSIWAQDSSDGRKDTNYVLTVNGGTVGAIYVEPTYGAEVAIKGGEIEKVVIYDPENGNKHDSLYGIVTGGTFNAAMDEKLVADGFELVENENGTFGIEEVTFVEPTISVDKGVIHVTDPSDAAAKVIVFYTGEGINSTVWANCVAAGKKYPEVNGKNGYMVYTDLENLPTLTTAGEYVVYLYYYEGESFKNIHITASVTDESYKDADELSVDIDENNKIVIGVPSAMGDFNKVVVFYTGEAPANTAWATCVAAGKLHQDVNGSAGYKYYTNPSVMPELTVDGTYVLYLYYQNAEGTLKNIRKVVTVDDAESEGPAEDSKPAISVDETGKVVFKNIAAENFSKVVYAYVGAENGGNTWNSMVTAGKANVAVNGANGYKVCKSADKLPTLTEAGNYVLYLYYFENGVQLNVRVVVTVG